MSIRCWCALLALTALSTRLTADVDQVRPCEHLQVPAVHNGAKIPVDAAVSCRDIAPFEILSAMKWLTTAIQGGCQEVWTISNFPVCKDISTTRPSEAIDLSCIIYIVHGNACGLSSVEVLAEHWLRRGCVVRYILPFQPSDCLNVAKNMNRHKTYNKMISWHKKLPNIKEIVDVLYLEDEKGRGVQLLGTLYTSLPLFRVNQFSLHLKYGCADIKNSEFGISRGWNMWALQYYLRTNGYFNDFTTSDSGTALDQPTCFSAAGKYGYLFGFKSGYL